MEKETGFNSSRGDALVNIKADHGNTVGDSGVPDGRPATTYNTKNDRLLRQSKSKRWISLFNFTTRKHLIPLISALTLTVAAGVLVPVSAIFLGKLFDAFSNFGADNSTGDELLEKVADNCIVLVSIGAATWVLNGGYFTLWLTFGELQARSVRELLFEDMLQKELEWFEMRKDGIGGFLPRLQT